MNSKTLQLKDLCDIITDGSHSSPKSVEHGYYMASVKDMTDFGFDFSDCRKISKEDYEVLVRNGCQPRKGDVLIAKDGNSYMEHYFVYHCDAPVVILSSIAIIRPNPSLLDSHYLLYYIQEPSVKADIKTNYVSGSAIPRIVLKSFKTIPIKVPSLYTQRAIASILSSLDNKVELNNRMNKTLEEMAQAIFKRWFVDFEFPDENGNPYKSSGGKMVESELGLIPEGWVVNRLGDICKTITKGTTPTTLKKAYTSQGVKFIKVESITESHLFDNGKFAHIDEETNLMLKRSIVYENDILLTIAGTIGRFALVTKDVLPANTNQAVAIIRINNYMTHPLYVYCNFLCGQHKRFLESKVVHAVQANLSLGIISELPIVLPSKKLSDNFILLISPILDLLFSNNMENSELVQLRDTLLPKLMSGEIRVPVTEA